MGGVVYLNGAFLPAEAACISPLDRGFLFGDGIYEVIPSYQGSFFLLDAHMERLRRSLHELRLPEPHVDQGWSGLVGKLLELNPGADRSVYLQVTRGAAPRDHAFPANVVATVFAMVSAIAPPRPDLGERGIATISLPDERWGRCDIKSVALLPNVLARQRAAEQGAVEAILLRDGMLTEGAASNVFVVHDGVVVTPPLDHGILPGITRRFLLAVLRDQGWTCREEPVAEPDLRSADEVWLTSSTKEILPVTSLDGQPLGEGRPGPLWRRALETFRRARDESIAAVRAGAAQ
jgi:D-alanine transaminase